MSDIALRVEKLSKQYTIAALRQRHDTLRDQIMEGLKSAFRRNGQPDSRTDTIWALRDVSFEVKRGEVLGIIGRNGAGKSTLLKTLSRITEPTSGRAEIFGRVGSLLEVGTGFDRELSGRENIYLNGAILGMKKAEIDRKFDEIVAFSEVEKFIDAPVKRYSSGMYVRLAFAVAAHLEPEILIVDEVLAVGDFAFQRKCLGRMRDVAGVGRTVLFVSHNMGAVKALCHRCLFLENGKVLADGPSDDVINHYLDYNQTMQGHQPGPIEADEGEGFLLHHKENNCGDITIFCGDPITLEFNIEVLKPHSTATVGIEIKILNRMGDPIVTMCSHVQRVPCITGPSRLWRVRCDLGCLPLNAGTYFVNVLAVVYVFNHVRSLAQFTNAMTIRVLEHDVFGWGRRLPSPTYWGPLYWAPQWDIRPVE